MGRNPAAAQGGGLARSKTNKQTQQFFLPGCRHGTRLAGGSGYFPQQGQDLLDLGQRGGPAQDHFHAGKLQYSILSVVQTCEHSYWVKSV